MVGVDCADGVAVLGEVELDGGQGVTGFEPADLGLADPAQFLERQGAGAAAGFQIGRERRDAFQKGLGASTRLRTGSRVPRGLAKGRQTSGSWSIVIFIRSPLG